MFSVTAFLESLPIMLYGMGGIFIVIGIIILTIVALCKIFPAKKEQ